MSTEWTRCTSLDRKMQLAWKAADQADRLALLPPAPGFGGAPELPSSARLPPSQVPRQQAPSHRQAHGPEAMEADAARAVPATPATRALLDACRALCRARGRCFRCLAPSVPGAHTGAADCPDLFVSAARRQAFVDECRTNPGHASVAAISAPPVLPTPLSYTAASPTNFSIHATAHSRSR
ncbi:hypothetical protein PtB15_3B345 [Puccinia triticina]|nr:hypothetical protein PtB15_3B345 [Puccinia triticina]